MINDHDSWKMTMWWMTLDPHQNQRRFCDPHCATCHHPAGCYCYSNDLFPEEEEQQRQQLQVHLLGVGVWEHISLGLQRQLLQQVQIPTVEQEAQRA